jgi:inorganic pyrophosphatase
MLSEINSYSTKEEGEKYTDEYRMYITLNGGKIISPWNDISFKSENDSVFNCVIEIPKNSIHKMEMSKNMKHNPILHDKNKDNSIRTFPFPIKWNYGFIPQTWEDPNHQIESLNNLSGDNDPVDIIILGDTTYCTGTVLEVKVIGTLAMIDNNEVDYKIIAIDNKHMNASKINTDADVRSYLNMDEINDIKEWFRTYKPNSNPPTYFGYDEKLLSIFETLKIIHDTHNHWKRKNSQ